MGNGRLWQERGKGLRITIKDIAARAGVSKTTVSFALNDPSRISEETRKRVMGVVAEFGFVPDSVARALATKRLGALGLLLPQSIPEALANPYLCELLRGIGQVCEERGLALTMLPPIRGQIEEAARRAAVDALLTIGIGPGTEVSKILQRRNLPFVTIDGSDSDSITNIGIDDETAATTLMAHILAIGHRHIAVLQLKPEAYLTPDETYSAVSIKRLSGFRKALRGEGLELGEPSCPVVPAEGSIEGGRIAAERLFAGDIDLPTAIVAMSDIIALGAIEACRIHGLLVPRDISIAGFDDIPQASRALPSLTTIRQPGFEKGAVAAALALDLLGGGSVTNCILPVELIKRDSTARPRATGSLRSSILGH
jgi:alanine racemase